MIDGFKGFTGEHCETTATGSLLYNMGIELSEPMMFGLGEGLGYIYWFSKGMDYPFFGGRCKTFELTKNLCRNLGLILHDRETTSVKKAWETVKSAIDQGRPVGLQLDSYHLEYFKSKIHFAGHFVCMYGYDEENAFLVDTSKQHGYVTSSLDSLALARNEKGNMAAKNRSYEIEGSIQVDIKDAIVSAIKNNAEVFLNPPIRNLGYKGIEKTAKEIKKWFRNSKDVELEFTTTAMLMENAGTGGSLFRNLYYQFLIEGYEIIKNPLISDAAEDFKVSATLWFQVAKYFEDAGRTKDARYIDEASDLLIKISKLEYKAMESLKEL